jgi:chloramphenicol O-acetyltransferase type B
MGTLRQLRIRVGLRSPKLRDHFPAGKRADQQPFVGVEIGRETYGVTEQNLKWFGPGSVLKIGSFCSISQEVVFISNHMHFLGRGSTFPFFEDDHPDPKPIIVGNDVLIGFRATILPGVTIGDGAVIGAGSVVRSDIPPYAIVAGNTAQVMRYRFDPETIDHLLYLKWWEWSDAELLAKKNLFKLDAAAFLAAVLT